jgi:hypothetical protein
MLRPLSRSVPSPSSCPYQIRPAAAVAAMTSSFVSAEPSTAAAAAIQDFIRTIFAQPNVKFSLQLTGGGAQALPWLFTVPGASSCVLEGNVPYATAALRGLIGKTPEHYCSADTAGDIAAAALQRAVGLLLADTLDFRALSRCNVFGVSCTAALVSQVIALHMSTVLCCDVMCYDMLCYAVLCYAMQCSVVHCCVVLCV